MKFTYLLLALALFAPSCGYSDVETSTAEPKSQLWGDFSNERPTCVRGIHLTAWVAGSRNTRPGIEKLLRETELNTVVIAVKEVNGDVFVPGVLLGNTTHFYQRAVPDLKNFVESLKSKGIYTIARVVVFKDSKLPMTHPEWAVKSSSPIPKAVELGYAEDVWVDYKGMPWADPYNAWTWKYNIDIAIKAAELGFQEIQFDYIRFPSDGPVELAVYNKVHSSTNAVRTLAKFLEKAREQLEPMGVKISIDVFGLAGSFNNDLGIGQKLSGLLDNIDVVSPMMYPSHYQNGVYGLASPNNSPYATVYQSVKDTLRVIGDRKVRLIPYLQDFSLGVNYGAEEVRDQIKATYDNGIYEWLLWNPSCKYTRNALEPFPEDSPLHPKNNPSN